MKLRSHLIGLVLVAVLPVLVFAGVVVALLARAQRATLELGLQGTTRALTAAVDERLASAVTSLQLLAASEDFDTPSFERLHRQAVRAVESQEGWEAVSVVRPDGEHVLNTTRPYGTRLTPLTDREYFQRVLETGQPVVSDFIVGKTTQVPVVVVAVPVVREGRMVYVLLGALEVEVFSQVLRAQNIPPEWTAAILDRKATILARSRDAEQYVGTPATGAIAERLRARDEDIIEERTKDGQLTHGAFKRSDTTGWTVILGLPSSALQGPVQRTLVTVLAGGAVLLLVAIGLALVVGRRVANPLLALSASAAALGREPLGEEVQGTGHEAGFQRTDQEAHDVELHFGADEHRACRGDAPGNHDARNPQPRAHPVQQHVAGHFEQEIAQEEHACAQTIYGVGQAEFALHLQLGETDVDAVQISRDKADDEQRHEAHRDLAEQGLVGGGVGRGLRQGAYPQGG